MPAVERQQRRARPTARPRSARATIADAELDAGRPPAPARRSVSSALPHCATRAPARISIGSRRSAPPPTISAGGDQQHAVEQAEQPSSSATTTRMPMASTASASSAGGPVQPGSGGAARASGRRSPSRGRRPPGRSRRGCSRRCRSLLARRRSSRLTRGAAPVRRPQPAGSRLAVDPEDRDAARSARSPRRPDRRHPAPLRRGAWRWTGC